MRGSTLPKENIYYYQIKTKDLDAPVFKCNSKNSQGEYFPDETLLIGHPVDLRFTTFEYIKVGKTRTGHAIKLKLYSPDVKEYYMIDVGWSALGRSMLNHLLMLPIPIKEPIQISLYCNKEGFHSISVQINRQWTGVRYKHEDWKPLIDKVPNPDNPTDPTDMINSYSRVNQALKEECTDGGLISAIQAHGKSILHIDEESPSEEEPVHIAELYDPDLDRSDDLPF